MKTTSPRERIAAVLGVASVELAPLSGGCVGKVYRVHLPDGESLVAKLGPPDGALAVEGWMLGYLAQHSVLPAPEVRHASNSLLLMSYIESGDAITPAAEAHAAELLAALHALTAPAFGLERDTVIGGLAQPNPTGTAWIQFFRDHRLLYMAREALDAGRLPIEIMGRLERLAGRLDRWLEEPDRPSLVHGDMWGGNVLVKAGRIAGFVDPAIYYADAEIELAFSTLFSTFGESFFRRYAEIRPIRPGFFEIRRDLYNLWPLLVHVRLFGAAYVSSVDRMLAKLGC